jgi:cytochrome c-type biogenesis protein CcmE
VAAQQAPKEKLFRLGGLVEEGSVKRQEDGVTVRFAVTDSLKAVTVEYKGILPDLFKEGKGVVTQGKLRPDGLFVAQEVLAKHDENYMPPEAATAMERAAKAKQQAATSLKP